MKQKFERVIYDLKHFSRNEKIILICIIALFLPFQYAAAFIAAILLYLLVSGQLIQCIKEQLGAKWLYSFIFLEIFVSLYWHNNIGLINSLGYLLIAFYIAFYRKNINPKLFNYIIHIYVFMSIFAAGYGLIEFNKISIRNGHSFFDFVIMDRPKDRINSTFMNANFYATMIDFFLIFCVYEFLRDDNLYKRIYYTLVALLNFGMLLLTGCRAALLPFVFIIPVFLWFHKKKKLFYAAMGVEITGGCMVILNPGLIPRIEDFGTVSSRFKIWKTAVKGILAHPLLGMGPQTYGFIYKSYNGKKAPHAHNIYLDSLLSYGIIGTGLLLGYLYSLFKEIWSIKDSKQAPLFYPMIICFILSALVQGLVDVTLNFLVTGTTFMMIMNSASMYLKKTVEKS